MHRPNPSLACASRSGRKSAPGKFPSAASGGHGRARPPGHTRRAGCCPAMLSNQSHHPIRRPPRRLPKLFMSNTALLHRKPPSVKTLPEVGAGAPNPAACQVRALVPGFQGGWCLVRPIPYCPHGFAYGDGYLCRHPEIERIIARTQAQQSGRAAGKTPPRAPAKR